MLCREYDIDAWKGIIDVFAMRISCLYEIPNTIEYEQYSGNVTLGNIYAAELKEAKKLQDRWEAAYKRFRFDSGVIKYVVKNYQYNEYGHIERRLMELHEAKDPAALSSNRGKMVVSGKLHLEVSTPTGFPSRIFYIPLKNDSSGKTVEITDIRKHNDPRYGKK